MKVLENHFGGKVTVLIHDRVINGCQDFHISKLDEVCSDFDVPQHMIDDVRNAYMGVSTESEQMQFVHHPQMQVRIVLARYGCDSALEILKDDDEWQVCREVARRGYALEEMKSARQITIRREVVRHGYALDELKRDGSVSVRVEVARQGYALDELKDDPSWWVRLEVVRHGYALDELKNDPVWEIRNAVVHYELQNRTIK